MYLKKTIFTFLLSIILIFFASFAFSQAQSNIKKLLEDAEQVRKINPDQFLKILNEIKPQINKASSYEKCFYEYLILYKLGLKGDYGKTVEELTKLQGSCKFLDIELRVKTLMANLQLISGDFEPALVNLNQGIELIEAIDNEYLVGQVYYVASMGYRLMHQDELSLNYADLLINSNHSAESLCYGQFNKYRIYMRQGLGENYKSEIDESIVNCKNTGNLIFSLFLQFDWYRYSINIGESNSVLAMDAADELMKMKDDVESTGFKNIQVYYNALLSHILWLAGNKKDAEINAKNAINQNSSIGDSEQLLLALNVLTGINFENGNYQLSYDYLSQKTKVEKNLYESRLAKQVTFFQVKHNTLAQKLEIERLNQSNQFLQLEKKLAVETSKKQWYLVALVLTGLVLLGLWTYRIKRRHDYFRSVSEVDHLTKVFTRKAFEEQLAQLIKNSKERLKPINMAILDLDHFKEVNDKYGHLVGDWVLQNVILVCEEVIDQDTLIARLGGEEFAIVTPDISMQKTKALLEKMRLAIENLDCSPAGHNFNVTASFGVTSSLISGLEQAILLTHADVALFEAKNNGRNQVVEYKGG